MPQLFGAKPSVVRLLLDKAADHSAVNDDQSTLIILAAEEGNSEIIAMLMEAGAAADVANSTGSMALHRAVRGGDLDCVELLVEKGHADYNRRKKNGQTPLHLAAANGHVDVVQYLLQKGAQLSATVEAFGTPLDFAMAMKTGHFDVVKFLVEKGANATMDLSESASWGDNAKILEFAQKHPLSFNLVSVLFERIVDVNEECEPYKTVLQAVARVGATSVMEELLAKGAEPNIKGGECGSALHAAILSQNPRSVKLLLKHDADLAIEHKGEGAIFLAIRHCALEVITALLDGMDSTARAAKDKNGRGLLACAINLRNQHVADYFLSLDNVPIHDRDLQGRTPLMEAVLRHNANMVKTLLELGADPNASDTERKTPLIRAITSADIHSEIVTALLEHPKLDPALKDCRGRTYAYWVARLGLERDAIEADASKSAKDRINWFQSSNLVLHAAIASGKESVMMDAICNIQGEDCAELDEDGWTAIYTATRYKVENMEEIEAELDVFFGRRPPSPTLDKPWKWHKEDKSPCLKVSDNGRNVTVMSELS